MLIKPENNEEKQVTAEHVGKKVLLIKTMKASLAVDGIVEAKIINVSSNGELFKMQKDGESAQWVYTSHYKVEDILSDDNMVDNEKNMCQNGEDNSITIREMIDELFTTPDESRPVRRTIPRNAVRQYDFYYPVWPYYTRFTC